MPSTVVVVRSDDGRGCGRKKKATNVADGSVSAAPVSGEKSEDNEETPVEEHHVEKQQNKTPKKPKMQTQKKESLEDVGDRDEKGKG
ncbi:hypothetical protein L2E82_50290 [Cichorium intybus]|nr:hypothetical protein L2E82_50290 [Cichorium intybus]